MFRILTISAWLWAYAMSRTFIWPNRLEGLLWIPSKSPDSWYNLTDLKGRIHQQYRYVARVAYDFPSCRVSRALAEVCVQL